MKDLKNLAQKMKEELLADLVLCISLDFDRENDLLCMTEQYYLYPEKRDELEVEMLELLLGNSYHNPFDFYHYYSQNHVEELDFILTDFAKEMEQTKNPKLSLENVIVQVSELHDKCCCELLDEFRIPKLETFIIAVADFAEASLILESNKRW